MCRLLGKTLYPVSVLPQADSITRSTCIMLAEPLCEVREYAVEQALREPKQHAGAV